MPNTNWQRIEQIFFDALEHAGDDRARFLSSACAGDDALRAEVEAMLLAHEGDRRLSPERWEDDGAPDALIGTRVGAYRIERLLGRGGMGDVYLASRDDAQFEHKVAVKLVRPGTRTAEMTERFRRERQILAHLEHPSIAALLDGGVTDDGRPYLVMQYVDGVPITDFCDRHSLSLRDRLAIFRAVCAAVQAAHVQLVVHRDIKPANVFVTATGDVKLLDFGIAKLLEPSGDAVFTRPLDRVMTPEHAAPEQVRGEPVTTATDVYALGVLLYQMITGERPLKLPSSAPSDVERVICEVEPAPPSSVAHEHRRAIRGELDAIVLMALRKEAARRYQSARDLNADIERLLAGQPVLAERDTFAYRARKFAGRHRWGMVVAAAFTAVVTAFLVVTVRQSQQVAAERDRAVAESAKSEKVVGLLTSLFQQSNPFVVPGGDTLRVRDFVANSEASVAEMRDEPDVQARMWETLGAIHEARSNLPKARELYERALALYDADPTQALDAARVRHQLATVTYTEEGAAASEPLFRESLARHRALLGDTHADVAVALCDLAGSVMDRNPDEAAALLDEALAMERALSASANMNLAATYNALGMLYTARAQPARAVPQFERALELLKEGLPADHPNTLTVLHNIASTHASLGDWSTAERMQREILATRRRVLGDDNAAVAGATQALAISQLNQGRYAEAESTFAEGLAIYESVYGPDHFMVTSETRNLGVASTLNGDASRGLQLLDGALATETRNGRTEFSSFAFMRCQRAFIRYHAQPGEGVVAEIRDALTDVDRLGRPNEGYRPDARVFLATILLDRGAFAEAETILRDVIERYRAAAAPDPRRIALANCLLAAALSSQSNRDAARALLTENFGTVKQWGMVYPLQRALIERARSETGLFRG